jgi:hypothetical protein
MGPAFGGHRGDRVFLLTRLMSKFKRWLLLVSLWAYSRLDRSDF